jgi:hypothetical protein
MSIPQNLKRLLSIRAAEEQQRRTQMDAGLSELRSLQAAFDKAQERHRRAQNLITDSLQSGACEDRLAGLKEAALAERLVRLLADRMKAADLRCAELRAGFLGKRVERRQVETLLEAARVQGDIDDERKAQRALDEWATGTHRKR